MTLKLHTFSVALGLLAVLTAFPAMAGDEDESKFVERQLGGEGGDSRGVRLVVDQVFYPGMSEKTGCRMQITLANEGNRTVNLSALVKTSDSRVGDLDAWLIPTGELRPGDKTLRVYSCQRAKSVTISRTTSYGWPAVCQVDGVDVSPCPVPIRLVTSLQPVDMP